jgi:hypothetical protein
MKAKSGQNGNAAVHDKRTYPNGIRTRGSSDAKVKFILEQAMKDHRGSKAIVLDGVNATPALPLGKRPSIYCTGSWVCPRTGLEGCENFSPPKFNPRTVQPVANCYTDCAIPAHLCWWRGPNICGIGSCWHKTHTWKCNNVRTYSTGVCYVFEYAVSVNT